MNKGSRFAKFNQLSYSYSALLFIKIIFVSSSKLITQHKEYEINNKSILCSTEISQAELLGSLFFSLYF